MAELEMCFLAVLKPSNPHTALRRSVSPPIPKNFFEMARRPACLETHPQNKARNHP